MSSESLGHAVVDGSQVRIPNAVLTTIDDVHRMFEVSFESDHVRSSCLPVEFRSAAVRRHAAQRYALDARWSLEMRCGRTRLLALKPRFPSTFLFLFLNKVGLTGRSKIIPPLNRRQASNIGRGL